MYFDDEPNNLERQILRERIVAKQAANAGRVLTAQFLSDQLGLSYGIRDFRCLTEEMEQVDGTLEIRVAVSPLNGTTESGNGTQNVPENQPLYCAILTSGNWRVEFSDGEQVLAAIVTNENLDHRTSRKLGRGGKRDDAS